MIKPYYETENGVLYHGDCLEVMKTFPDKSIDLILTDPPYGTNICSQGSVGGDKMCKTTDYGKQTWDERIPSREVFQEMFRVSKNQVIFGGNYFVEYLSNSPCFIVWDKDNSGNFADCELAWTSFKTATRIVKFRWNGMLQGDMKHKEKRYHPTQKPVYVMRWILERYSKPTDLVLDPFLGSGTTSVSCKQLERKFIGVEKKLKYCKIARKRIDQTNVQWDLL